MPKVKISGKIKKFPYTKKGITEAKEAAGNSGMVMMGRKKKTNTHGMKYLKG